MDGANNRKAVPGIVSAGELVPAPHSGGLPFRRSAIPGVRVRVRVRLGLTLADLRNGGPPEWQIGIGELGILCLSSSKSTARSSLR